MDYIYKWKFRQPCAKGHHTLELNVYELYTDWGENRSYLYYELYLCSYSYDWNYSATVPAWYHININGEVVDGNVMNYYPANKPTPNDEGWQLLTSGNTYATHNPNGTRQINVYAAIDSLDKSFLCGWGEINQDIWMTDIPRQATLGWIPENFDDENSFTIYYDNPSGSNVGYGELQAYISSWSKDNWDVIDIKYLQPTNTSYTFDLTEAEKDKLRTFCSDANSKEVYLYLATKIRGVWYYDWKAITLNILNGDLEFNPTAEDINPKTLELTGNNQTIIKGESNVQFAVNAYGRKNGTIESEWVQCGSYEEYISSGIINGADYGGIRFWARDSRGNIEDWTKPMNFIDYFKPTVNLNAKPELQSGQKTTINIDVNGYYCSCNFGQIDNTIELWYRYKENRIETWNDWIKVIPEVVDGKYKFKTKIENLNYEKAYDVEVWVQDKLNVITSIVKNLSTIPVFDWGAKDFNFNVPVKVQGCNLADIIAEEGTNSGWKYKKYKSGKCELWKKGTISTKIDGSWGYLYYGKHIDNFAYPFTFKEQPVEVCTMTSPDAAVLCYTERGGYNSTGSSGWYAPCSPVATNTNITVNYNIYTCGYLANTKTLAASEGDKK